jgi:hypothetical protein
VQRETKTEKKRYNAVSKKDEELRDPVFLLTIVHAVLEDEDPYPYGTDNASV